MREIKFRAWSKKDKVMLGWNLIRQTAFPDLVYKVFTNWDLDFELMQYTGLKDKNGKEIYESDILEIHNFDNKNWVSNKLQEVHFVYGEIIPFIEFIPHSEIIGNVFENPELLEK